MIRLIIILIGSGVYHTIWTPANTDVGGEGESGKQRRRHVPKLVLELRII